MALSDYDTVKELVDEVFELVMDKTENVDLRKRGFFYQKLL